MNGGKTRVLVVENNKDLCEVIEALLKEEDDMELAGVAYDGVQALEMIPKTQPDVILLDIIMPYLDGMEVLSRLNEASPDDRPRVIVLSAFEEEEMVRRCARLGADYYLLKPFDSNNLITRIRQVVSGEPSAPKPKGERVYASRDRGRDADRKPRGAQFDLETESTRILYNLGVPTYFKGYSYIKEAIMLVTRDIGLLGAVTKSLYPKVAEKFGTTPLIVEAAIRYTIQKTWKQGNPEFINKIFGYAVNLRDGRPPTNSFFIAKLAEELRLEMLEHAQ
ncbi:MAG: sporulation transcription factor Spo0A [Firmicutes bacterium]|nr:sporulation transcription factor Spo0A [Bacillota bacterium]MDD4792350.1 sporulation transcription factor Spo0A [Bacillota bacterium]